MVSRPNQWIHSPAWDSAFVLSGITICALLLALQPLGFHFQIVAVLLASQRLVALTHSWSTTYIVTASPMFAGLRKAQRDKFLLVPILLFLFSLILGVVVAKYAMISDEGLLTWRSAPYYLYIALFMFGHFWHFGRQDFGVLSIYRNRAGQNSARDRILDERYTQIMMYVIQPIMYFQIFPKFPFTIIFTWALPLFQIISIAAKVALVAAFVLTAAIVINEIRKSNRSAPKLLYYVVMLFHPVLLYYSSALTFIYWQVAYLWSHWLIATSLSYRIHSGYLLKNGSTRVQAFVQHAVVIGAVSLIVWWVTSPLADISITQRDFIDAYEILRSMKAEDYTWVGLFFGFVLGEQLVHYYCDRCLFRFKDPGVRNVVARHL
ncbi:MAG: hypothetical protein ABL958_00670 [Bdellovibrionia bacterium]